MGFSWWFDSEDVSTESFFKFLPRKYDPNLEYASSSERVFWKRKYLILIVRTPKVQYIQN
jgi:hypothetical protein